MCNQLTFYRPIFAKKKIARRHKMLQSLKIVRISYDNMNIEKLLKSAFKQNQVFHNQMMESCHIVHTGAKTKSVVHDS